MKKLLFILFTVNCFSQAPNIVWQKSLGGSNNDVGYSIRQTNDGGYIAVGATISNDAIPLGNYHGNYDVYVIKTNSIGTIEWQKTIGGSNYDVGISVIQTQDNSYIISGYTSSGDGDFTLNHGLSDCFVVKLDVTGTIIWQKTYGGSQNDNSYILIQTNDGGYILAGTTKSNDGQVSQNHGIIDGWLLKIDALGTVEWEKSFGGTNTEFINSIIQTTDNGYAFVGHTYSNDGDISQNQGNCDGWIVKLSTTGAIEWQKTYGGSESDYLYTIKQTADGGYITCGQAESSNGNLSVNHGLEDAWILKLNSLGNIEWNKTYGGSSSDGLNSIMQTSNGAYILAGSTYSNDFDINSNHGGLDCLIVKLTSSGDLVWQKMYGGTESDAINDIVKTADNGFSFVGYSNSNNGDTTSNHGSSDMWLVKLSAEQLSNTTFHQNNLIIFPNPTTGLLHIQISNDKIIDKIAITDLMGKIISEQYQNTNQISTEILSSGIYFIQAYSGGNKYQTKFIKQ